MMHKVDLNDETAVMHWEQILHEAEKAYSDHLANGGKVDENEEQSIYHLGYILDLIYRLKRENERLKAENACLTVENEVLKRDVQNIGRTLEDGKEEVERVRKETAKEILERLIELSENPCNGREEIYKTVFEKYGVEVEE